MSVVYNKLVGDISVVSRGSSFVISDNQSTVCGEFLRLTAGGCALPAKQIGRRRITVFVPPSLGNIDHGIDVAITDTGSSVIDRLNATVGVIAFVVQEKERAHVPFVSFGERLNALPKSFRRFVVGVGLFGAGDFAHSMPILLAVQKLTPEYGAAKAASLATALYVLHNIFYSLFLRRRLAR